MKAGFGGLAVAALACGCLACGGGEAPAPASNRTARAEPAAPPAAEPQAQAPVQGRMRGGPQAPPAAAPKDAKPAPVQVTTSLSRTAVWAGDPVVWTVEIACAPGFDVIADDFAQDKLRLEGLEVVTAEADQAPSADGGVIHRARFTLRSFATNLRTLRTEPLKVRYFERKPGQRAEDITPAGELVIPPARVAWRSTIPEGSFENGVFLRDARAAEPPPALFGFARQAGMSLVLVSIAPVVLWVASRVHEARKPKQRRPSVRATRSETRNVLATLRASNPTTEQELREAYTRLSETLRRHVSATTGVPATALVSGEIARRLNGAGGRLSGETLAELLAECDRVRYSPPDRAPAPDRFRDSLDAVERLL